MAERSEATRWRASASHRARRRRAPEPRSGGPGWWVGWAGTPAQGTTASGDARGGEPEAKRSRPLCPPPLPCETRARGTQQLGKAERERRGPGDLQSSRANVQGAPLQWLPRSIEKPPGEDPWSSAGAGLRGVPATPRPGLPGCDRLHVPAEVGSPEHVSGTPLECGGQGPGPVSTRSQGGGRAGGFAL